MSSAFELAARLRLSSLPQTLGGAHDPPRVAEAVSRAVIKLPLQTLMTSWSMNMTHLQVVAGSVAGQANVEQQHVTYITSDSNTTCQQHRQPHRTALCTDLWQKNRCYECMVTCCSYKVRNNSPGRMLPERSPSLGRPGKRRVWWRFWTTTKVMGGLYSELGSPMPRQAAASCIHTQDRQHSKQALEYNAMLM